MNLSLHLGFLNHELVREHLTKRIVSLFMLEIKIQFFSLKKQLLLEFFFKNICEDNIIESCQGSRVSKKEALEEALEL